MVRRILYTPPVPDGTRRPVALQRWID